MKTPQLLIVVCTKSNTDEAFALRPIYKSLKLQYETNKNINFHIFKDNKRGLSECYNEILNNSENLDKTVLFVHDDVVLEDLFLYEKLINSPYSITGLAGAKTFNMNAQTLAWHIASDRSNYVGEVAHCKDGIVWTTVFGPTNSRALILDGLFLSCKVNELKEKNIQFDNDFGFHFYDIVFCLNANKNKATCGVLPIRVQHYGIGDSMLSEDFKNSEILFKQKYKNT
jgi:hypothetical protein